MIENMVKRMTDENVLEQIHLHQGRGQRTVMHNITCTQTLTKMFGFLKTLIENLKLLTNIHYLQTELFV